MSKSFKIYNPNILNSSEEGLGHSKEKCKYCSKELANKYTLDRHYLTCKMFNSVETQIKINQEQKQEIMELIMQKTILENNYSILKQSYEDLKETYKILQDDLIKNPKIINNNNNTYCNTTNLTIKQMVSKLEPITQENIKESMKLLDEEYIDAGIQGFAKFLCEHSCNKKFITTDASRNTIAYRTNYDDFIRDPECLLLINSVLRNNGEEIIFKAKERRDYFRKLMDFLLEEDNLSPFQSEKYTNIRLKIHELIKITESAMADIPDDNIKKIANVLSAHGISANTNLKEITQE
jgi:hypothetical protein